MMLYKWLVIVCSLFCIAAQHNNRPETVTLDLEQVNIVSALQMIAKFTHQNIVMSPAVNGVVSLRVQDVNPEQLLTTILSTQALQANPMGNTLYIMTQEEARKRDLEQLQFQTLTNETCPLSHRAWTIRYAKAQDVARFLQGSERSVLSKRGLVQIDVRTNLLFVQDVPKTISLVNTLIQKLDVPLKQIRIEAHLASVDYDYERELGLQFVTRRGVSTGEEVHASQLTLALATLGNQTELDAILTALENEGHGELISSPRLYTANQQTALIESGEEIPYQETSRSGATTVAFKKAVLSLEVTPQLLPGNKVLLQLKINQDKPNHRVVLGVPAITTRQMTTSILVKNGQTIVLGGIYELDKEHLSHRIPFLHKIPFVGSLFQQQNAKISKRELLIFVTPIIN